MTTLIVTRGLPGSGKTTWAKAWVAMDPEHRARVNRDDLRGMLHDTSWNHDLERQAQSVRDAAIAQLLKRGVAVACDDTNLPSRTVRDLRRIAVRAGADFQVMDFTDIPLPVCLARNADRTDKLPVPTSVIETMYTKFIQGRPYPLPIADEPVNNPDEPGVLELYVPDTSKPRIVIADIDGTVALKGDRSPFDETRVHEDRPNEPVINMIKAAARGLDAAVVFVSGRTDACREPTVQWLWDAGLGYLSPEEGPGLRIMLHMRKAGDGRPDTEVKAEIFDQEIRHNYNVLGVFDDRNQVVRTWRSMGLQVYQVADGDF